MDNSDTPPALPARDWQLNTNTVKWRAVPKSLLATAPSSDTGCTWRLLRLRLPTFSWLLPIPQSSDLGNASIVSKEAADPDDPSKNEIFELNRSDHL